MAEKRLTIVSPTIDPSTSSHVKPGRNSASRLVRSKEAEARFERLWLVDPNQFDPERNAMQQERLERTWHLLNKFVDLNGKRVVDLGCGSGVFTRRMRDAGARIDAIDIAENALKLFRKQGSDHINLKQEAMPVTSLPDHAYDVVVCLDVLAELPPQDYRLFFSELARLVKQDGYVLASTPIDIFSEGGVERLKDFIATEFTLLCFVPSYHAFYIRLKHVLESPDQFVKGWLDPDVRQKELNLRIGFGRWWYWINTTFIFMWLWLALQLILNPFIGLLRRSHFLLLHLEKACHFLWDDAGISHFIFIAQEKPLQMEEEPHELPIERPKKKEIWE